MAPWERDASPPEGQALEDHVLTLVTCGVLRAEPEVGQEGAGAAPPSPADAEGSGSSRTMVQRALMVDECFLLALGAGLAAVTALGL